MSVRLSRNQLTLILKAITEAHIRRTAEGALDDTVRTLRSLEDKLGSLQGESFELAEVGPEAKFPQQVRDQLRKPGERD